jgi:uncharacterized membrane protein YphA (DoxX/SURF4 family)
MNTFTRIFLVVLRLAIGWLFLFEGLEKVRSLDFAPTATTKPFSSAGYLSQSSGPLSPLFQWQIGGNADANAIERLTLDPSGGVSPALRSDWQDYLERFADHYGLDASQREQAKRELEASLAHATAWITDNTHAKEMERDTSFPSAAFTPKKTPVQRISEFRAKVEEYRRAQDETNMTFGSDVSGAKLRTLKADAAKMRTSLMDDLNAPFREGLDYVLTDEQWDAAPLGPVPPPWQLVWTDRVVSYGLVVVGGCLLLGLFTRLNAFAGALFLIMLYLALPAVPWLPESLRGKWHYPPVNENLIVALALLALATTRSGKWFGLDGLVQFLNPWRSRAADRKLKHEPETMAV